MNEFEKRELFLQDGMDGSIWERPDPMDIEPGKLRHFTIAELAEQEFCAAERLRALGMMNTPTDFDERKKAAIAYAEAKAEAVRAKLALDHAINNPR